MIVVTGATGQLGHLVITSLLKKVPASSIVAAVRNVEKAADLAALGVQVRQADYNQPASWDAALKGADKVLLISSSEIGQRARQHQAVIDAAKRAGVKLLAYTSVLHADTSILGLAAEHRATEAAIKASGVPYVFLRNGWYIENYAMAIPTALQMGSVFGCAGEGRISGAARADYAEAAAVALTSEGQAGKTYELAGDSAFTLGEFAAELAKQTGKAINYVNLPEAEYKKALLGAGLPELLAELLANSDTGVSKGALLDDGKQLSKLIGRPTTAMSATVKAVLQ
ncbi:MAG: SDR family oxidoreductase [Halothiobacillaceae bacterium]|nr:SDR family oxidoreductase [Halothiobacillaceae bacterium]